MASSYSAPSTSVSEDERLVSAVEYSGSLEICVDLTLTSLGTDHLYATPLAIEVRHLYHTLVGLI
jgi:hypothetical protein